MNKFRRFLDRISAETFQKIDHFAVDADNWQFWGKTKLIFYSFKFIFRRNITDKKTEIYMFFFSVFSR